jgi:hypothetical protein
MKTNAQSMQVSSPIAKQNNSRSVQVRQIYLFIYPLKVRHSTPYNGSFGTL